MRVHNTDYVVTGLVHDGTQDAKAQDVHAHEPAQQKHGMMDKVMDKLPGHHNTKNVDSL